MIITIMVRSHLMSW